MTDKPTPKEIDDLVQSAQAFVLEPTSLQKKLHLEAQAWGPLADTPQPARAQPVALEPLTYEQIQDLLLCGDPTDEAMRLIRIGRDAAHGIKGGQHVE